MTEETASVDPHDRIPTLYLAPWVDFGGSDKGTIDWFRWLDRDRFAPSLITTQPSPNRRLPDVYPFAEEVWALPDHFAGNQFPQVIFDFLHTRRVRVLHIMNSRLGFELLPDLAALPAPPKVVVQLHVEEHDRSGYVRYVTTRYGNLVDGFSVTSRHLARAIEEYEVPRSKLHVIPTGVDARGEFNPDRVRPLDGVREPGAFHILFAGRLVDQKDPLLMVEVISRVARRHDHVRVHVVGDGPLEAAVRARVGQLGLDQVFRFHPPSTQLPRWLRSADLLLMTSVFEGVPYIVYEAMAMGLPVVAPALPGNVELMGDTGGSLIDPRDDADAYAEAIGAMIEDPGLHDRLAHGGRDRMLQSFSLREMAARHEALYDELLRSWRPPDPPPPTPPGPAPLRFRNRPARGTPPVSVVTPCFNHGRYLDGFLDALHAQQYPALETIIVDDGSTDPETRDILARIDRDGRARVIHQDENRGPSVARNRAVAAATGRYILPVDADNVLLPGAVHRLVAQLQEAGERIGFIYPSFQYFGTRDYRFDPPTYNLFLLMQGNFADTCSLLDREIFDAGLRYPEDIELGHEDWDLALELGLREVLGEPSREPVMLYRKQGFTRSDLVEYLRLPFWREVQNRHPALFGSEQDVGGWGRFRGPARAIKAQWCPALSIVLADPVDFDSEAGWTLLAGLGAQSCGDFELIAECPRAPERAPFPVRRLAPGLCAGAGERAQEGLDVSRGRFLVISAAPGRLFADPTAVERMLRDLATNGAIDAVALADLGGRRHRFQRADHVPREAEAHTIAWQRELHGGLPPSITLPRDRPAADLAAFMFGLGVRMQWRHLAAPAPGPAASGPAAPAPERTLVFERAASAALTENDRLERDLRLKQPPALPATPADTVPRWSSLPTWMPPETVPLVRHREVDGPGRVVSNDRYPPPGHVIEFDIGAIQHFSPPGTQRLVQRDGQFITVPRATPRDKSDVVLGYLEEAPLPLFVGVMRVGLPDGSQTLVLHSERDPLFRPEAPGEFLGFIETFPNEPVHAPGVSRYEALALVRLLDRSQRRHRYEVVAPGDRLTSPLPVAAELGALLPHEGPGRIALWIDGAGRIGTDRCPPASPVPRPGRVVRWVGAPASWDDAADPDARARAVARRAYDLARLAQTRVGDVRSALRDPGTTRTRRTLGYLHAEPGEGRMELFCAVHPVLGDQFITPYRLQATDMGYERVCSLGFIEARAPLTGVLGERGLAVPWASHFGLRARRG